MFEARYGKQTGDKDLIEFIDEVYLPWARQNKRTWKHDQFRALTIADWFKGKKFSQISPLLIEKFKKEAVRIDHQEGHEAERRIRQSRIGVAVKNLQSGD